MQTVVITILVVLVLVFYWGSISYKKLSVSKELVSEAVPFSHITDNRSKTLLVLGDSTAVGVGVTEKADSIPAKVAAHIHATHVENYAVSGARIKDIESQLAYATQSKYDVILLQVGANDIMRFSSTEEISPYLEVLLKDLSEKGETVIFISAGNVGGAPIIPPPLRSLYTKVNLKYHELFKKMSDLYGVRYINLYESADKDPFIQQPEVYFAADSFHPSSAGYEVWFKMLVSELKEK